MADKDPVVSPSTKQNGDNGQSSGNDGDEVIVTNDPISDDGTDDSSTDDKGGTSKEPKFTQKDLNAAAAKARREEQEKANRKKQEEQGEFEKLYSTEAQKALELEKKLLTRDICDELEIPRDWRGSVTGEDEDSIRESASSLKERLDKIIADAVKEQKNNKPGTPPAQEGGGSADDAEKKGKERTKDLVLQAMGFVPKK